MVRLKCLLALSLVLSGGGCSFEAPAGLGPRCGAVYCSQDQVCQLGNLCVTLLPDAGSLLHCGDGRLDVGEECDDGDGRDDDACTNACRWAVCGDGIVRRGVEDCEAPDPTCLGSCLRADGFVTPSGHVFTMQLSQSGEGWPQASERCAASGLARHLATLGDQDWQPVYDNFLGQTYWIGLTDADVEGEFHWITGEPDGTFHFRQSQPSNNGSTTLDEDCIDERPQSPGVNIGWNDEACTHTGFAALCERDVPLLRGLDHHGYVIGWSAGDHEAAAVTCQTGGFALAEVDLAEQNELLPLPARGDFHLANATGGGGCLALRLEDPLPELIPVDCAAPLPALCEAD